MAWPGGLRLAAALPVGMEGEERPEKKPGLVESLAENEEQLATLAERIVNSIDGYVTKREKHLRALESGRAKFVAKMTLAAFGLIGAALIVTAYLAWLHVVSGEVFAAIVGALVGSVVTFLGERIAPLLFEAPSTTVEE